MQNFDAIWENILSEDQQKVRSSFNALNKNEKNYVLSHLQKMSAEDGWHPGQVASATFALNALTSENNKK